jgi:diguanylate cyclase (GGDEF)-like protein
MTSKARNLLRAVWSRPDAVLAEAGLKGEVLVAKVRLGLAAALLLIPVINALFFPTDRGEMLVGLVLTSAIFAICLIAYLLVAREYNPPWLGFATSSFDVTVVSGALAVFLFLNQPHTAVNSKVIFEGYFLAIASTSLRYDKRICISAGVLAVTEYLAIVVFASVHWDLNSPMYAPYPYGMFGWSAQQSRLIILVAASVLSLALVYRSQTLLQMATSDPLTGLFNRGYMDERMALETGRAGRYDRLLTIAVIDVDHFKALNDTHGHLSGDMVLRSFGRLLRESFRTSDTAGRYGGEEFVVLLPETGLEAAQRKLESLRAQIASTPIQLAGPGQYAQMTISVGLAGFPQDGRDAARLFAVADERMFQAKRDGRNRVVPEVVSRSSHSEERDLVIIHGSEPDGE